MMHTIGFSRFTPAYDMKVRDQLLLNNADLTRSSQLFYRTVKTSTVKTTE
jgi:hypothetical protein